MLQACPTRPAARPRQCIPYQMQQQLPTTTDHASDKDTRRSRRGPLVGRDSRRGKTHLAACHSARDTHLGFLTSQRRKSIPRQVAACVNFYSWIALAPTRPASCESRSAACHCLGHRLCRRRIGRQVFHLLELQHLPGLGRGDSNQGVIRRDRLGKPAR